MTQIEKDKRYSSLEVAKKLGITAHAHWVSKNIIKNKESIERVTKQVVLIEAIKNKRGKPTLVAYLTEPQVVYLVSNSANSYKTQTKKMKEELAVMFRKLAEEAGALESLPNQWTVYKNNIVTTNTLRPADVTEDEMGYKYKEYPSEEYTVGCFSPDVVFAEFLETLESDVGYSMKWDFDIDTKYNHPVTAEQYEKLKVYQWMMSYDKHFTPEGEQTDCYMYLWGEDSLPELPELSEICIDTEIPAWGVAWVNEPKGYKKAWQKFVTQACRIVDIYNSPELRAKYGIVSHEEEATGDWDTLDVNSEPLEDIIEAAKEKDNLIAEWNDDEAVGFKVHKDWVEWLQSDARQATLARDLHLGSHRPIIFQDRKVKNHYTFDDMIMGRDISEYKYESDKRTKYIHYEYWEAYENGFEWARTYSEVWAAQGDNNPPKEPPLRADRPLFQHVRLYTDELRPLFDWYLSNIWLPQRSVKYFQTIDPQGFPLLCEGMKSLKPSSSTPMQFIKAMQPVLAGGAD